jgi:hypothetical protein
VAKQAEALERENSARYDLDQRAAPDALEAFWKAEYQQHLASRVLAIMRADFEEKTWKTCAAAESAGLPCSCRDPNHREHPGPRPRAETSAESPLHAYRRSEATPGPPGFLVVACTRLGYHQPDDRSLQQERDERQPTESGETVMPWPLSQD